MLPLSAKDIVEFTPSGHDDTDPNAPVYLIAPASIGGRARFRREVTRAGARSPTTQEFARALRDAAKALLPPEQRDERLEDIDATFGVTQRDALRMVAVEDGEEIPEETRELIEQVSRVSEFENVALRDWPPYAELRADQDYWWTVARLIAARLFLRGWRNLEAKFEPGSDGGATDEAFEGVPEEHLLEIGQKAISLFSLGRDVKKN